MNTVRMPRSTHFVPNVASPAAIVHILIVVSNHMASNFIISYHQLAGPELCGF